MKAKAKGISKFADEEKRIVDAGLGLILYTIGIVVIVTGFLKVLYYLNTIGRLLLDAYLGIWLLVGIVIFAISMWVFKARV